MKSLTPIQIAQIQDTLAHARAGRATLAQLAEAHDLAEGASLNGTLGELRAHMRAMVPCPSNGKAKSLMWGFMGGLIASSIVDFYVYRTLDHFHNSRPKGPACR